MKPRSTSQRIAPAKLLATLALPLLAACASAPPENLGRLAVRAGDTYGPTCTSRGPINLQAWGQCVAQAYTRAESTHGGTCSDWQLKSPSYPDCVIDASVRSGLAPAVPSPGPYCITMNVGGGVDPSNCRN